MRDGQRMFDQTGALHAAALVSPALEPLWVREDVGRHNAVDKVIGKALFEDRVPLTDHTLVVSGRISYEIVHKALTACIGAVVAVSGPTSLAIDLARAHGLVLAGFARGGRMNVYSGDERITTGGARMTAAHAEWSTDAARDLLARIDEPGPVLVALQALQEAFGYVHPDALQLVADAFNVSRADVYGVMTFYTRPAERAARADVEVRVCMGEACQAVGARGLLAAAQSVLSADVDVTHVFCMGNCALGPTAVVNGRLIGRASADRVRSAVAGGGRMTTIYVPRDSAARSVGRRRRRGGPGGRTARRTHRAQRLARDAVARAARRGGHTRTAGWPTGPSPPTTCRPSPPALPDGGAHPLRLGVTDELPWLASQTRLTFARVGVVDPLDPDDFVAHGGLAGLRRALLARGAEQAIEDVLASGLRGRGGAGFPAGIKWRTVAQAEAAQKYVCVNADEGDSGTYADRMLIEGDPFTLIEGMAIAGLSVGATTGYVYLRSEYPDAVDTLRAAIALARDRGWLGPDVLGSGRAFDVHVRVGAGSYVCGEETAMLESLEGRRGMVRAKPPLPAHRGPLRAADAHQQRPHDGRGAVHPRARPGGVRRPRLRAIPGHAGLPAGRQHPAGRHRGDGLRHHPARARRGVRRRHAVGTSPACRAARWARWAPTCPPTALDVADGLRGGRRGRAACSATAASWCSTTRSTWRSRRGSRWSSAPRSRAASAPRAGSARCAASR